MQERGFRDLRVYQAAYAAAMEIYEISKGFPKEERYSLTDQVRRSSRSIVANIAEGYRKRPYPKLFVPKMIEADGEVAETQVWLDMARDYTYLSDEKHDDLTERYQQIGKMLGAMIARPERFSQVTSKQP